MYVSLSLSPSLSLFIYTYIVFTCIHTYLQVRAANVEARLSDDVVVALAELHEDIAKIRTHHEQMHLAMSHAKACVYAFACVCVCVRARACVRVCVCAPYVSLTRPICVSHTPHMCLSVIRDLCVNLGQAVLAARAPDLVCMCVCVYIYRYI